MNMKLFDKVLVGQTPKSPIRIFSNAAFPFWLIFLLLIIDRVWVLHVFGFRFTSNDDIIFWQGAKDYANGIFHEPFMYGQNYNFMLESVFAAPFIRFGAAPNFVFPIVTSFLSLLPFFAFGFSSLRNGNLPAACLFLAFPLLLPVQYELLTTISRGFVTGIFFFAFYPRISRVEKNWLRYLLVGAIFGASLIVNPNTLPLILLFFFLIFLREFRFWRTFVFGLIGALPFLIVYYFARHFYIVHPEFLIHEISDWMLAFHWDLVWEAFGQLDRHFAYLCPLWWPNGSIALLLLLAGIVVLFRFKYPKEAIAFSVALLLILFSLAFAKVHDGKDSVFFAYSRMFLALPLILCVLFSIYSEKIKKPLRFAILLTLTCIVFLPIKLVKAKSIVQEETQHQTDLPIKIARIDSLRINAEKINAVAQKEKADVVIGIEGQHIYMDLECWLWGGECLYTDFKPTLVCNLERRSWRTTEEMSQIHKTVLLLGGKKGWLDHYLLVHSNASICNDGQIMMYVLHDNKQSIHDLLQELGEVK